MLNWGLDYGNAFREYLESKLTAEQLARLNKERKKKQAEWGRSFLKKYLEADVLGEMAFLISTHEMKQKGNPTMRKLAKKLEEELNEMNYTHGLLSDSLLALSKQIEKAQTLLSDLTNEIEEAEND